jgi:ABC-type cobalamin/Fe3+-siderophores transport system ATPase subunit
MTGIDISNLDRRIFTTNVQALKGVISSYPPELKKSAQNLIKALDIVLSYTTVEKSGHMPSKYRDTLTYELTKFKEHALQYDFDNEELIERIETLTNSADFLSIARAQTIPHLKQHVTQVTSNLDIPQQTKTVSESVDKQIKLPNKSKVDATTPIIIIGPNGSGKSSLGHKISRTNKNSVWFSAHRQLQVPDQISMQTVEQTETQIKNQRVQSGKKQNVYESELSFLLNNLRALHSKTAEDYLSQSRFHDQLDPPTTKLEQLWAIWSSIFPAREIVWQDYSLSAKSSYSGSSHSNYVVNDMSGGEKSALYLLLKVITAEDEALLIIDEPELHFHSLLAQQFWSKMEAIRPDCRFIYITHDLQFSASRQKPKYIVVHQPDQYEVLADSELPQELFLKILGTNTFSLNAKKVIFVEGKSTTSLDLRLYKQWFINEGHSVIVQSVESCESVIRHTTAFNEAGLFKGIEAIGIIDRDYRSDFDIKALRNNSIHVLDLHELESCLCSQEIFESIYNDNDHDHINDASEKFEQFLQQLKVELGNDKAQADVVFERTKVASEKILLNSLNKCKQYTKKGLDNTQTAIHSIGNNIDLSKIFETEKIRCQKVVSEGSYEEILQIFDGKTILNKLHRQIPSMNAKVYVGEALKGLRRLDSVGHCLVGVAVVNTLEKYLPPRDFG